MGRTLVDQGNHQSNTGTINCDEKENTMSPTLLTPPVFYTSAEEEDEDDHHLQHQHNGIERNNIDLISNDTIELSLYPNQVAGHVYNGKQVGIVKFNEALLKPIPNGVFFEREANFYENLQNVNGTGGCECDPDAFIKRLVPKYFGRSAVQVNGSCVQCLVMEDLTRGMREPCIMDVKIGRRTWDPDASMEKIVCEDAKYIETKREYGFCIPGFQVYDVQNGTVEKFDRVYGKQLNKDTIIDALRIFLNGKDKPVSRALLVQILVDLWHIQRWARKQHRHRLYSSSILLIYDARRLRQKLDLTPKPPPPAPVSSPTMPRKGTACSLRRTNSLYRPLSLAILNDKCTKTGFSGQLNKEGPIFPCKATKHKLALSQQPSEVKLTAASLKRMHSFQNNYDEELRSIRTDYASILEDLVTEKHSEVWAGARMIDFAHAFPADDPSRPDVNYLDGVENLVRIIEDFLAESNV